MQPRKGSHSVFSVQLHIVFVTHYRRKVITDAMLVRLGQMIEQVAVKMGCKVLEFSGESDHVHLLLDFHPRNSISSVVSSLKAATSRMVKKEFPSEYAKHYWGDKAFWAGSYYVNSVGGAPLEVVKNYIANQFTPEKQSLSIPNPPSG